MASQERVEQVKEAIMSHLKNVGAHDWEEVQKDFLDVPPSSFWRYVRKAKEQLQKPIVPEIASDLFSATEQTKETQDPENKSGLNCALRLLKHAQRFFELYADVLALRQHALDEDGRIRDAPLFAKSIRLRNQLLVDELNVVDGINLTDLNTEFFDALQEALDKASPEVAQAVFDSLNKLKEERIPRALH
jgi:hypothetical protein